MFLEEGYDHHGKASKLLGYENEKRGCSEKMDQLEGHDHSQHHDAKKCGISRCGTPVPSCKPVSQQKNVHLNFNRCAAEEIICNTEVGMLKPSQVKTAVMLHREKSQSKPKRYLPDVPGKFIKSNK